MPPMPKSRRFAPLLLPLLILGLSTEARPADEARFFSVLEAELLGGYSKVEGSSGTGSTIDNWLFAPTWKVNDNTYWINVYNGFYNHSAQVVAQEEGGRGTETTQGHSLATSFKYEINDTWSLRPLFFVDWIFVNETEDESFGEGLYDYRDIGGGLESAWILQQTETQMDDVRLGFRFLDREYPNYRSLLSLFNPNGSIETNEKDLSGYKVNLSRDVRSKENWSWGLEGIFFYKDYTDKKTINFNGIRTGDGREDTVEYLNVYVSHPLSGGWFFRLDGQAAFNQSNLDFYDTHNTGTFADDDFISDYYDYTSLTVKPTFTYVRGLGEERNFIFTADYAFNALLYSGRRAQNTAGVYSSEEEEDFKHTVSAKTNYPLTKNVSWVVYGSYTVAESNQDFENFYLYTYDLWTAVTGISLKF